MKNRGEMKKIIKFLQVIPLVLCLVILPGCAAFNAVAGMLGSHSSTNSGTSVNGNHLHAGPKNTKTTLTAYKKVGTIHNHYLRQMGDYVVLIAVILAAVGIFILMTYQFRSLMREKDED